MSYRSFLQTSASAAARPLTTFRRTMRRTKNISQIMTLKTDRGPGTTRESCGKADQTRIPRYFAAILLGTGEGLGIQAREAGPVDRRLAARPSMGRSQLCGSRAGIIRQHEVGDP